MRSLFASTWLGAWILLSTAAYGGSDVADTTLVEFDIEDQFKRKHSDAEFHGRMLIVVGSDRHSSQISGAWTRSIRDSLAIVAELGRVSVVEVADVRGVPFFVKGKVRGGFPKDSMQWVLLDWKGKFPKAYKWGKDMVNILVFDSAGRLTYQVAATSLEPTTLTEIVRAARAETGSMARESGHETAEDAVVDSASAAMEHAQDAHRE